MLWLDFPRLLSFLSVSITVTNAFAAFHPIQRHFSLHTSGTNTHHGSAKPTARHKNHCAYVIEKTVSYTVQNGAAPYVKAEYQACGWKKKCPRLKYRILYKPMFKVAYKTVTELEWRCCPGFTGGCNTGSGAYGMKAMPPFKGHVPSYPGPQLSSKPPSSSSYKSSMSPLKGPMPAFEGQEPSFNGPVNAYEEHVPPHQAPVPMFQGPMYQPNYNTRVWNRPLAPPNLMNEYSGSNAAQPYSGTSFKPYEEPEPDHPETGPEQHSPLTDNDQDSVHDPILDHHQAGNYQDPKRDNQPSIPQPEAKVVPETQASSGDNELNQAVEENYVSLERLNQMEEDVQRLSLGLETLHGKVTSLEDHLRASLWEEANRMLSTLLSAARAPITTVGFGDLPGEAPDTEGLDAIDQFPNLRELAEKVAELRVEVLAKSTDLVELKKKVLDHDGVIQRLSGGAMNLTESQRGLEILVESKLGTAGEPVLGELAKRVEAAEQHCEDRVMEIHLQCKKGIVQGQEQLELVVNGSMTALKLELANISAELQRLEAEGSCCMVMSGITERLVLIQQSMDGLNQSQGHLQAELGGHKDHVEGMIEGRLAYLESVLHTTEQPQRSDGEKTAGVLEDCLENKVKDLEIRLFAAMEELDNATSIALDECQTTPTLDTEVKSLKKRLDEDLDLIQKQFNSLERVCTAAGSPQPVLTGHAASQIILEEKDKKAHGNLNQQLNAQTERLDQLNDTLSSLLMQLTESQKEKELQSEVTILKVRMHSVNHTLCGLKDSFVEVVREVGQANLTWQDREERLAQQVKGVVQLVGRQASMLGAGERRLTRLKGELQDLRRKLASEFQTCHSTALGVQKEVTDVGGRVARVEGQCGGLSQLAENLEMIRGELEKHSDGYLSQINSTLVTHSIQLSELKDELKNCTKASGLTGDHFIAVTQPWKVEPNIEPPKLIGDPFIDPTQV